MRIKKIAELTGVPIDAIRHYERTGLLPPPARGDNNYRRYGDADLQRLRFIRNCRALAMSLCEVRQLLDALDSPREDCAPVDTLVAEHLTHVRDRIAELRQLERQLGDLQRSCGERRTREHCGILRSLSSSKRVPSTPRTRAIAALPPLNTRRGP
jgi:Cd(II)/Pb(II)-responsive transcriptional regulator